ncbi:MAG: phosphotransferase, partial [Pseudoalteromonas distincta]
MDSRKAQLEAWLPSQLAETYAACGWGDVGDGQLSAASADASFRRYFRWRDGQRSLVVMDAPPENEDSTSFVRIAGLLAESGARTPTIHAADLDQGFLLLEDMGTHTYLQSIEQGVSAAELDRLYKEAITTLIRWQQTSRPGVLPDYDETILRRELQLFPDWYVGRHLNREFSAGEAQDWDALCRVLLDSVLAEPQVFVHRDYMPRNLM